MKKKIELTLKDKQEAAKQRAAKDPKDPNTKNQQDMFAAVELKSQLELAEQIDEVSEPIYLDLGEHNDFWYYGTSIKERDALITSDKKIYRNTLEIVKSKAGPIALGVNEIQELGLNYEGHIGNIAPRWSRNSVQTFFKGKSEEKIDKLFVYKSIKDKIDYFMDFSVEGSEQASAVQACWCLGTYCYTLFYWFPNVLHNGPRESGKSKNGFIMTNLSFAGYDIGASAGVSPAQIFRTLENNRGTILIDEYEKTDTETQQLVNQVLNAGVTKNAYVIRNEQVGKSWIQKKFPIFCPKIVCNISGINPTSLSRFIPFHLLKTKGLKSKRKPWRKNELDEFKPIRDNCHILIMQNWKDIKKIYDTLELNLSGRDEDNWRPICAIAKWLGDDVFKEVIDYINSHQEISIETSDLEEDLFRKLILNVENEIKWYSCKQIAGWLVDELASYKSPTNWVGRVLTNYKFKCKHREAGRGYFLSKIIVQNIIDRYYTNISSDSSDSSFTSDSSDSSGKQAELPDVSELFSVQGEGL